MPTGFEKSAWKGRRAQSQIVGLPRVSLNHFRPEKFATKTQWIVAESQYSIRNRKQ